MSQATAPAPASRHGGVYHAVWGRQLDHYPNDARRYFYLGLVVVVTIVLYYLYYVEGAVTPEMLPYYHMSFRYFLYLLVVSNAVGAFTAFIGGLSDRIGRANLTILGTLTVGLIQLVGVPNIHSEFGFAAAYTVIGFVEGIILVSTPALIRDFSPQMGRAAAMGFWALGPVLGSLAASLVANHTIGQPPHVHPWQDQFIISGVVCMVVVALSFSFLRELAPRLRDQLMVSENERALVEARAMGIDVERAISRPLRSMFRLDLISSATGIAVFLLIYYASVSVLTLYWVVIFNRSTADANGINTWYWVADSITLVVVGVISDRLRVRKPFMLMGAAGSIVMTLFFISQASHPHTSYYDNVIVVVLLGITIGFSYTPWMAAYTEAVEAHNPALAATGLAVWGWILRIVVAGSFLVLPVVITTATTLVDNQAAGTELQAFQAAQPYVPAIGAKTSPAAAPAHVISSLRAVGKPGPTALADILVAYDASSPSQSPTTRLLGAAGKLPKSLSSYSTALLSFNSAATAVQAGKQPAASDLTTLKKASPHDLYPLVLAAEKVVPAQKRAPHQWQHWWWVCLGGQALFLLLVFTMRGRWSPRAARADFEEHERRVSAELAGLRGETVPAT